MHAPVSTDGRQGTVRCGRGQAERIGQRGKGRRQGAVGKPGRNSTGQCRTVRERARRPDSDEDWQPIARTEHRHASGEGEGARGHTTHARHTRGEEGGRRGPGRGRGRSPTADRAQALTGREEEEGKQQRGRESEAGEGRDAADRRRAPTADRAQTRRRAEGEGRKRQREARGAGEGRERG